MSGYYDGLNSCGGSSSNEPPRDSDGGQDGRSRGDLIEDLCNFAETNPSAAAGIALLLGYPGLDAAVRALCFLSQISLPFLYHFSRSKPI